VPQKAAVAASRTATAALWIKRCSDGPREFGLAEAARMQSGMAGAISFTAHMCSTTLSFAVLCLTQKERL
jgi:hypothetical protein